ncbi:hypothetical protein DAPPUDRAFT_305927 [Daphnia pulex]|uniref:Glycosyl hydrolase family 13 catalytic domain-containing protein n=1 Tax=Daphnia pulex TaxID=6669 RepID=E9GTT6_DAPPU|nr:hypothetical protein DAPPUDRAFT_305927 [Daphnia pulex]|eukprot:EFX77149.1 hypothetical protein DAPPUDRAFT_305927 [Daphnia pulex]
MIQGHLVLNHVTGAGASDGSGGSDPAAWNDKYTNFRYVSFATPATTENEADYLSRAGRFPKNWENFHNNPGHDCLSGDICAGYWGPDVCYYPGAYGQSSNAIHNPPQSSDYMRNEVRSWLIWYKKQMGIDGWRFDAVKHFLPSAMEDFLYNLQFSAGWASGGDEMFAVGEYVGGGAELDNWCASVQNRAGTFDFGLRGSIYGIITGNGNFDMGSIPGAQQGNRLRTVPFVNNHDTFRPILTTDGNYNGWDTSQELAAHIDPYDGRLSAAYAVAFAVDGTPTVFIEDLFDLGKLGNRFTHDPKVAAQLPMRSDIANIIWCHQHLRFKEGAYKVPHGSGDLLVIERSGKAIIGVTDSWTAWQTVTIGTDFPAGTVLKDHSGATVETATVGGDKTVTIKVPPCNGEALNGRRCYAIWGPLTPPGYTANVRETTQEWEMADDLGDSHPLSLQQGGQLPAYSVETRTVGKIFVAASSPVTFYLFLSDSLNGVTVELYNDQTLVHSESPSVTGSYTPNFTGWLTIKVRNTEATSPGQIVWVVMTYKPPAQVTTDLFDSKLNATGDWDLYHRMVNWPPSKL